MNTKTVFAILAASLLAVGGLALAVEAKPDQGQGPDRREQAKEKMEERKNQMEARCQTLANESKEQRCEHLVGAAFKARRAGAALQGAIDAHKRILERVNATIALPPKYICPQLVLMARPR
ncbi:MAG: hypothetical protein ABR562_05930 [Thermoplasmatota archaeon]